MKTLTLSGTFLLLMACVAYAESSTDVLDYSIAANAVKLGPINTRDPKQKMFNYFLSGSAPAENTLIGREIYHADILISREIFNEGKRHGIWRKWHRNGHLASEAPYDTGDMNGVFRHWSESGKLIGQYEIVNGKGLKRIYNESGELVDEQSIESNKPNGLLMEYFANDGTRSLVWQKDGNNVGNAFSFYRTGNVMGITCHSSEGGLLGPHLGFSPTGSLTKNAWYIRGKEVSESAYAGAAASDPRLPPYYSDATEYKQFVNAEVRALLEKYRTMPRVKIPLEFDEHGNPVLATPPS